MSYVLKTNQLTKVFEGKEVISGVNMHVKKGEIYGFLGPNGAGKTTIMKMITNLIKPTSGDIEIFGEKLTDTSYDVLKRMGTIIEYPIFYDKLTAKENLYLHCEYMGYYDKKGIEHALDLVNLHNVENKKVKDFSLGMKQRLGIARAILTKPELLILDEPINGLDPIGIRELRDLFKMLCKEYGITLLVSSHILGEMEQMADTIGVIQNGKLIKEVSMKSINGKQTEYIEIQVQDVKRAAYILENKLSITNYKIMSESMIRVYEMTATQQEISKALIMNDVEIESINKKHSSLEEYFLNLVNGEGIHA
ncbi:bacitracin ABC transporter ATP-binding protein [Bacillus pseudomycoides]|uniref:Bacitracin ABC transporter ATP-binding protein n=1 Tax=Bacillus pseudomycoides TaxID=64104 RepID=A0AA91ZR39_9BACI|nr:MULTISPECIES: ABC transporter ATP-binding protein [Bacillus]PEB51295.1 bacitracin ABC transporter ATP-binding protein [Bacillus sp. AFS098217]PED80049.1 bacitracin ABC transporter ATP-binding protein [Bacillus pseudomycoides]PEU07002.1 bacitracin ABC transporter ATP-binding protein [Bacillus sp. AFS019443]PEU20950.1 bacitracin ABC transporter ATP-binding protein [Bacillus sp. AFS014408]PFW58781.1 bacitracin ABC transporter ATP-binding protein [Bacillus sp. AFS075034]